MGEHLRKVRMDRELLQREVAARFGVNRGTIRDWELGHSSPEPRFFPPLIEFLGFVPFEIGDTLPEQLRAHRKLRGLSRSQLASQIGVCQGTVWRWEQGKREPAIEHWPAVIDFLGDLPFEVGEDLPDRIRAYRKICGLTADQLADRLGVDGSTVRGWERGEHRPSSEHRERLEALFKTLPAEGEDEGK